jgi:hypothetical protein
VVEVRWSKYEQRGAPREYRIVFLPCLILQNSSNELIGICSEIETFLTAQLQRQDERFYFFQTDKYRVERRCLVIGKWLTFIVI